MRRGRRPAVRVRLMSPAPTRPGPSVRAAVPASPPGALDRDDGIPLYLKLASLLREAIARAEPPQGGRLAPIPALQAQYGVARSTVRQALAVLEDEGLISSGRGRGTTVIAPPDGAGRDMPVYSAAQLPPGITFKVLWRRPCDRVPDIGMDVGLTGPLMQVRKRNDFRASPYSLVDVWVPRALYDRCPRGADRRRLYSHLLADHAGIGSLRGHQLITVVRASYETAQLLEIPFSAPVARIASRLWDQTDRPVMAHVTLIRADLFAVERSFGDAVHGDPLTWRPKMPTTRGAGETESDGTEADGTESDGTGSGGAQADGTGADDALEA